MYGGNLDVDEAHDQRGRGQLYLLLRLLMLYSDTEGMASLNRDSTNDAKIFTLANLISSYLIFNSVGNIDEKSIA